MRFAVAALCVLALTGAAEATDPCAGYFNAAGNGYAKGSPPPMWARQKPNVPYVTVFLSPSKLKMFCHRSNLWGCAIPKIKPGTPFRWVVAIDKTVDPKAIACIELYERAHMPPNSWGDPTVESASIMRRLHLSDQPRN